MIRIKNISKAFGDKTVLEGITHDFHRGKSNLIIGASGSGKSVLMKIIVGLIRPDSGEILYDGHNLLQMDLNERKELRQQIGMLFQGSALFSSMTVEQNVMFPLDMLTKKNYREKLELVNTILARVNLVDANKKYPAELSGGMQKRVGIARAIVLRPKYLFVDEPNSGLDPKTSILIDALIKSLTAEFNIVTIINTHDMNSVMDMGDNILYLHQGHSQWVGSSKEIIFSEDEHLNDFIFASEFLKDAKEMRIWEETHKSPKVPDPETE